MVTWMTYLLVSCTSPKQIFSADDNNHKIIILGSWIFSVALVFVIGLKKNFFLDFRIKKVVLW